MNRNLVIFKSGLPPHQGHPRGERFQQADVGNLCKEDPHARFNIVSGRRTDTGDRHSLSHPHHLNTQKHRRRKMDNDRVEGSARQAKGAVKEAAGKITGDAKLKAEGRTDKAAGKIQNAIGGVKDTLRGE